jgi:Domain of unknown function (DUF4129)
MIGADLVHPIGRDQARELARQELRKTIYHRDDPSVVDRIVSRITDWLNNLFGHSVAPHTSSGMSWGGLIVLVAVVVIVVAAIWWRLGGVRRSAAQSNALLDDQAGSAKDHRSESERLAAAGQWAEAIRERLRAIARDLEERAILTPRPGRTADELATEAGSALPGQAAALHEGVRIFDDVWYGGRTPSADGYQRLTALDESVRSAKPEPLRTPQPSQDTMAGPL